MELRNRTIGEESKNMSEEEEALIEPDVDVRDGSGETVTSEKTGIAGDERNILVLLFLYVLQVNNNQ